MSKFELKADFQPTGDQPQAIGNLLTNLDAGMREQVLLGVTGSGKTFTMANVIARLNRPTLVVSHNKTLAAQLYQEFKEFFPKNAVCYFVSYYDYYQPEAYLPSSDTYIEKETEINEEIDKLRLAATTNLLTRPDTIIVASVSCIYNIGSPREYGHFVLELRNGMQLKRRSLLERLVQLQYERSDFGFSRGSFRVRGETVDIFPAYADTALRLITTDDRLVGIEKLDPLGGTRIEVLKSTFIYPAKHYMTDPKSYQEVFTQIRQDLDQQLKLLRSRGKMLEAHRLQQRVNYDLEMIAEMGYVNGIENYSRYFDGRSPGDPPYTLFDYYAEAVGGRTDPSSWLLFIDESHMSVPQIRGMYNGDRSRKQTLVDYGFRLPAALDNRPLTFAEFLRRMPQTVYVSATPADWEITRAQEAAAGAPLAKPVVEQLVRPTGLIDPQVILRPAKGQIADLVSEITKRAKKGERALVTTLTKQMAEDLTDFLSQKQIRVQYLHSDVLTLARTDILSDLRSGAFDCIVGVNLLREGLDLPEVSLVAILDADKEGFLRSRTSLIQTMGRAARHIAGQVILYADTLTDSMRQAVAEVERRRQVQLEYNRQHHITPQTIKKPLRGKLVETAATPGESEVGELLRLDKEKINALTPFDKRKLLQRLTGQMRHASRDLDFELAARLRDLIARLS